MDLGLKGRTALVLASTGGLGAATARALGAEGANVIVSGRNEERAKQIASELPSATGVRCDLSEPGAAELLVAATREAYGEPDIVVLNGPGPKPGSPTDLGPGDARAAIDLLVETHVALVTLTLPAMRAAGWGRILSVGSSGVQQPIPTLAASNVGRAALAAYLKPLATEIAGDGVTVNMLLPGRIATDRVASLDAAAAERTGKSVEETRKAAEATIPVGRYGDPAEFGAVAAFLCSDLASYVTGSQVRCDGGMIAHP
ncbi:MAG: SDR family oxidoreductase [Actinomycetia bacterium]|nr:SDR family oxidoreductase [Actinomycetes bacterium]